MSDPSWRLLRTDRSFRHYWLGQTAAAAGAQVTAMAIPLITVIALDAGPAAVSLVATAGTLPYLLFSLVAGHLLHGRDQKRTMVTADMAQALLLAVIPLAWLGGWLSVPLLAAVTFLSGTCALLFGLSAFAYVPALIQDHERDLAPANRAVQGTRTVTEISGPGLAGLLVSVAGAPGAVLATILGHVASAVGVASSRPRKYAATAKAEGKRSSALTGMRILISDRHLRALTIHAATYNAAEQVLFLNLIIWAVQERGVGPGTYGLALAAAGVGGLIGTLTALQLAGKAGLGRAFALSLLLSCAVPVLLPVWPASGAVLAVIIGAVMLVRGIGEGNANVYSLTMRQRLIPGNELTRSAGAYTQVMYGSIPLGALLAGAVGETLGVRTGVLIGAVGLVLSAVPMMAPAFLRLRTIPARSPAPESAA